MTVHSDENLETQIAAWRSYMRRRRAVHDTDVEGARGSPAGIDHRPDEGGPATKAFLVAVTRMGNLDNLSREFAQVHSERLWKQLVVAVIRRQPRRLDRAATCCSSGAALQRPPSASKSPSSSASISPTTRASTRNTSLFAWHRSLRTSPFGAGHRVGRRHPVACARRRRRQYLSAGRQLAEHRPLRQSIYHWRCGSSSASRTPAVIGAPIASAWTSSDSRVSGSSTTCSSRSAAACSQR